MLYKKILWSMINPPTAIKKGHSLKINVTNEGLYVYIYILTFSKMWNKSKQHCFQIYKKRNTVSNLMSYDSRRWQTW